MGHYQDQIRITIPKDLAVESGLFEAGFAEINFNEAKRLEVVVFEWDKKGQWVGKGNQS